MLCILLDVFTHNKFQGLFKMANLSTGPVPYCRVHICVHETHWKLPCRFLEVFHCCLLHFAMKRLAMYTMVHTHKDYRFLPRVVDTLFSFLTEQLKHSDLNLSINSKL